MDEMVMTSAVTSGEVLASASGTAASPSLRRSKRDSVAKTDSGKTVLSIQEDSASSAATATRRSQRSSVKSAVTTPTNETPPSTVVRETSGKKTVKLEGPEPAESEPQQRRTRPTRGVTVVVSTDPMTPVASPQFSPAQAPTDVDGEALATSAVMLTPTRNRRPSRRQLEVDAPTQKSHLLLGEFSANDATALCEVVWYQIKENSYKPDVLLRDHSPARIDWHRVAERLSKSHEITLTPRACQRLWKFLTYAQDMPEGDELLEDSEPEDYELGSDKINARVAAAEHNPQIEERTNTADAINDATSTEATEGDTTIEAAPSEPLASSTQATEPTEPSLAAATTTETTTPAVDTSVCVPREMRRTNGIQLFPEYDQPPGIPDEWRKHFDLKQSMPLVFVAEKFLRRKAIPAKDPSAANGNHPSTSMEVDPSILAAAAMNVTLTGERKPQPKYKKKRTSDAGGADEKKPKKPRKKKELATGIGITLAGKPPVLPLGTTTTAIASTAAVTKSPVPIRQSYVPSLTAPPTPTPARTAANFFSQLYKENPAILHSSRGAEEKQDDITTPTPPSPAAVSVNLDAAQFAAIYSSAPLHVRTACEQMANDDLRRFEREHLRRRLWEKTRASLQNSPAPSPAAAPPASPFPTASTPPSSVSSVSAAVAPVVQASAAAALVPEAVAGGSLISSSSVGTTSHISTSLPSAQVP